MPDVLPESGAIGPIAFQEIGSPAWIAFGQAVWLRIDLRYRAWLSHHDDRLNRPAGSFTSPGKNRYGARTRIRTWNRNR
jgi:hypothetical protein